MALGLMARWPVARTSGGGMIGGWWLVAGRKDAGPWGSISLHRDACKITVFETIFRLPPSATHPLS